ncbi:hypothetical protein NDU88_006761 [Pleurodeles waltl]|uniref:Uncharacterized protein n=1 Tax=Pleurodeles waltl TaxID=8319 RepID=A0AAV7NUE0_PLEWA|nr:hypothetical protein NDU88_006761 [Pleurodeles waltl]
MLVRGGLWCKEIFWEPWLVCVASRTPGLSRIKSLTGGALGLRGHFLRPASSAPRDSAVFGMGTALYHDRVRVSRCEKMSGQPSDLVASTDVNYLLLGLAQTHSALRDPAC